MVHALAYLFCLALPGKLFSAELIETILTSVTLSTWLPLPPMLHNLCRRGIQRLFVVAAISGPFRGKFFPLRRGNSRPALPPPNKEWLILAESCCDVTDGALTVLKPGKTSEKITLLLVEKLLLDDVQTSTHIS